MSDTTIVRGGLVVTMDDERRVVKADLRLEGDRIAAIGTR